MTERERFESWARQRWTHPEDFDQRIKAPSKYNNYEVQAAWDAWQERAAQNAPIIPELSDDLIEAIGSRAEQSYRRHHSGIRGQQFTPADALSWHIIRATRSVLVEAMEAKP